MAVDPSLIASNEYSTWKRRPSGENVLECISAASQSEIGLAHLIPRSYSDRAINIVEMQARVSSGSSEYYEKEGRCLQGDGDKSRAQEAVDFVIEV